MPKSISSFRQACIFTYTYTHMHFLHSFHLSESRTHANNIDIQTLTIFYACHNTVQTNKSPTMQLQPTVYTKHTLQDLPKVLATLSPNRKTHKNSTHTQHRGKTKRGKKHMHNLHLISGPSAVLRNHYQWMTLKIQSKSPTCCP